MRLCSIASGSSGNCIYVGSDTTHLLIDVGISGKRVECGLQELGISAKELDGILITHEHIDHISGLGVMARRHNIPIYATQDTIEVLKKTKSIGAIDKDLFVEVEADFKTKIKDLQINPMRISHDAVSPVAYRVNYGSQKIAVCTDLGYFNDYTIESLKGLDALLLEANHDINMLQVGTYPYYLKQRILGNKGLCSNENSGRLLNEIIHDKIQAIVLGHLSNENNLPELAYEAVRMEITLGNNPYHANDFNIQVARRSSISQVIEIA